MMQAIGVGQVGRMMSHAMFVVCALCAVVIIGLLGLVTSYLVGIGFSSLSWEFFTAVPTGDVTNPGGMKHAIVGTIILVGLAAVIGVPLGMLAGVYLSEYGTESWIAGPTRFVADVLAGVPSIVVGILGYELLVVPTTEGAAFSSSQAESADTLPAQAPSNRTTWRGESEVMPQVVLQGCRARQNAQEK
jgi:phosphate transport system permease protein